MPYSYTLGSIITHDPERKLEEKWALRHLTTVLVPGPSHRGGHTTNGYKFVVAFHTEDTAPSEIPEVLLKHGIFVPSILHHPLMLPRTEAAGGDSPKPASVPVLTLSYPFEEDFERNEGWMATCWASRLGNSYFPPYRDPTGAISGEEVIRDMIKLGTVSFRSLILDLHQQPARESLVPAVKALALAIERIKSKMERDASAYAKIVSDESALAFIVRSTIALRHLTIVF